MPPIWAQYAGTNFNPVSEEEKIFDSSLAFYSCFRPPAACALLHVHLTGRNMETQSIDKMPYRPTDAFPAGSTASGGSAAAKKGNLGNNGKLLAAPTKTALSI